MSEPLLSTPKHDIKQLDTAFDSIQASKDIQTDEEESDEWHEITIEERDSLLTSLNRVRVYWREIVFNKIRFLLTVVFVTTLNIVTRLVSFTRQKPAAQFTSPIVTSSNHQKFEENLNGSSKSFIDFNSDTDLPSIETSPMAHMLVQQQTPNINIHQTTSTNDENLSPTAHSLDDRLFFYDPDSTSLLEFLQRFASESHLPKYQTTSNGFINKNLGYKPKETEKQFDSLNCDIIQPVVSEIIKSNELDNISPATTTDEIDEDVLLNANSTLNIERHFRRRKRRSSLTKTSSLDDKIEPITTDSIEKVDDNNNNTTVQEDNAQPIIIEGLSLHEKEESNDKTTPPIRLRARKFRHRAYQQKPDNTVEFFIPTETPISVSPPSPSPLSSPSTSSPSSLSSPSPSNSNSIVGGLKRSGSVGTTKKMVRFADSIGRELAQVQYIQSPTDDDDLKDFSLGKNGLYLPKTSLTEHKPWSFDVASPSKQISDKPISRRFFCLYRQPNSEHPDIYLHEIWKSQIKLEHADVRLKSPLTGEQYLHGTLWVTNASYWKNVTVKYSFNRWVNTYEYEAQYRFHSNDFRNIDQFEFNIDIPQDVDRIDFVLRYHVNGQEHWDNNGGKNYTIETDSASTPQTIISLPHDCDFNEMRFY